MLVSLNTVKKYVSLEGLTPEDIANGLTFAGIEVEEINYQASGTNLIIGEILECEPHPNSDHLHVLKVNLGLKYGIEQIVCGAPNARKGLKVIVARVGAKLPDGEIKKGVIRGIESNGMCCSLLELGVNAKFLKEEQTKGIEELPLDATVGEEDVLGYLGLDDVVLNVKVLANRPDLLSVYNVAREIGAIFERVANIPVAEEKVDFQTKYVVGSETSTCTQFSAKEVRGIKVKDSPNWMKSALMAMGIRSINNIVDIGNYVMLMTGQPLHMYDADKLAKKELIARNDYEGKFVALDEKEYDIIKGDIVITCDRKPMCLGGVMGSLECAVDENSKNIVIESASFDGATIRHTSNRLGLVSESSQRFVKGTNHFQAEQVLAFAANLCNELCEAKENSNIVSYQSETKVENKLATGVVGLNNRLGTNFSGEVIRSTLDRLGFNVVLNPNGFISAVVPEWRLDVTCDADLAEEVIRLQGFSNVNSVLPTLKTTLGKYREDQARLKHIREFLLDNGLDECLTYSLVSKNEVKLFNLLNKDEPYVILNPLTDEHEAFRTHILHSLLKAATFNVARQNKDLALFETSHMQSKTNRETHVACVLVGNEPQRGLMNEIPYDFYHMKGIVEGIFSTLGIESTRFKLDRFVDEEGNLHPGKAASISFQGKVVGIFGELHPDKIKEYDLGKTSAVVLEMKLDDLLNAKISEIKMSPISRFPSVVRDLAFVVAKEVEAKDIIKSIKMISKGIVSSVDVFDVYEGEHIEQGKKSVAISITYSKLDSTLTEKEVTDLEDSIKFELTKAYKAELRG